MALSQRSLANTRRADTYASYPPGTRLPGRCQKAHARRLLHRREARQRSLKRSIYANDFKVSDFGREIAISKRRWLQTKRYSQHYGSCRVQDLSVTAARNRNVMPTSSLRPIAVVSQILSIEHQTMVKLLLRLFSIIWRCCGTSLRANQAHRQMREFLDQALDGSEVAIR